MSDVVSTYLSCWNETDAGARRALVAQHWSTTATYVDPMGTASGVEAVAGLIGAVQEQFPGFVFSPVGTADAHHDLVRFRWGLGERGAEPVVVGFDVVVLDAAGRIERVLGFLDRVPA